MVLRVVSPTVVLGKMRFGARQKSLTGYGVWDFLLLSSLIPFFETIYDSVKRCSFKKMAGKIHFDRLRVIDHCAKHLLIFTSTAT